MKSQSNNIAHLVKAQTQPGKQGISIQRLLQAEKKLRDEITKEFNYRIDKWYEAAKRDYNVNGKGYGYFDDNPRQIDKNYLVYDFHVRYEENEKKHIASFSADMEQLTENKIDWLFIIWSEGSMPSTEQKN